MSSASNDNAARNGARECVICGATVVPAYSPFCSKRCADIDLHRWLNESYAIPSAEEDDSAGARDEHGG